MWTGLERQQHATVDRAFAGVSCLARCAGKLPEAAVALVVAVVNVIAVVVYDESAGLHTECPGA